MVKSSQREQLLETHRYINVEHDLEREYDYLTSDEAVWETIEANELDQVEEAA